jgi:hypothetical protein
VCGDGTLHRVAQIRHVSRSKRRQLWFFDPDAASIGSVGDAYDAAAGSIMGLFKNEAIAKNSHFWLGPF